MPLKLFRAGFGTKKTGFMTVIDRDAASIDLLTNAAAADPFLSTFLINGKLQFKVADFANMPEICKQSVYDAIVDYKGLDSLLAGPKALGVPAMLRCIDHVQNAVRLGNILVCISQLEKSTFCQPFEQRFGWVQELDGEPGEISAWYRGMSNIPAKSSAFKELGLFMYVYTNTDNC